jgi:magnesium-transporting ATPase (P-type)
MTVVIELEPDRKVRVYTKGASENIIDDCSTMLDKDSKEIDLDLSKREKIKDSVLKSMAQNSLRTIALGYRDLTMS